MVHLRLIEERPVTADPDENCMRFFLQGSDSNEEYIFTISVTHFYQRKFGINEQNRRNVFLWVVDYELKKPLLGDEIFIKLSKEYPRGLPFRADALQEHPQVFEVSSSERIGF